MFPIQRSRIVGTSSQTKSYLQKESYHVRRTEQIDRPSLG